MTRSPPQSIAPGRDGAALGDVGDLAVGKAQAAAQDFAFGRTSVALARIVSVIVVFLSCGRAKRHAVWPAITGLSHRVTGAATPGAMDQMKRYAVYYAPRPGAFADRAADWLGWDAGGQAVPSPSLPGIPVRGHHRRRRAAMAFTAPCARRSGWPRA